MERNLILLFRTLKNRNDLEINYSKFEKKSHLKVTSEGNVRNGKLIQVSENRES